MNYDSSSQVLLLSKSFSILHHLHNCVLCVIQMLWCYAKFLNKLVVYCVCVRV